MINSAPGNETDYPRPHFDRSHSWRSLIGTWDFVADPDANMDPAAVLDPEFIWPETIEVPYAWETPASGVGQHWLCRGWYRTRLDIPREWSRQHIVLHFGAVHHAATVWVNGSLVGDHEGGYLPFEIDITHATPADESWIVVRVDAPLDKRDIVHGKQRSIPADDYDGCSFTPTSGIWQPVWAEARPATHIESVRLIPNNSLDGFLADIRISGPNADQAEVQITVSGQQPVTTIGSQRDLALPILNPRRWSPSDPHLYHVAIQAGSIDGADTVSTSSGLRNIVVEKGHLLLNGERLYVRGVLDQGYWPHTGASPASGAAFATDIELARAAGYNLIRKHLKLEDPRFLHEADRRGMLVWAEPASTGRFTPTAVDRFEAQIEPMVRRDGNHPCIVIWGLYNEEWGLDWDVPGDPVKQDAVRRAVRTLEAADSTRPIVDNSGWSHVAGDLVDWHIYDERPAGWAAKVAALLVDRRPGFPVSIAVDTVVEKQLMADGTYPPEDTPLLNGEYGGGYTSVERGWNLRWQTQELRRHDRLSGYVWTELYDIEHETAGIYTFDRAGKDDGGNPPALANADTVIIIDAVPRHPGEDLVTTSRDLLLTARISHHGLPRSSAKLVSYWGQSMKSPTNPPPPDALRHATTVDLVPFACSEPITVDFHLPEGSAAGRLHIVLIHDDAILASTHLDIVTDPPRP